MHSSHFECSGIQSGNIPPCIHTLGLLIYDHLSILAEGVDSLREQVIGLGNVVTSDSKVGTAADIDVAAVFQLYKDKLYIK